MSNLINQNFKARNIFYFSANYDFEVLENYFFNSHSKIINCRQKAIYYNKADASESIIYYETIHILQLSFSFIEKSLKYLISYYDKNETCSTLKKNYGHDLSKLTSKIIELMIPLLKRKSKKYLVLYNNFIKIKFDTLRYLDDKLQIIININIFKNIINDFKKYIRLKRNDEIIANGKNIKDNYPKFKISHYQIERIPKIIYYESFKILLKSEDLLNNEKELLKSSYRFNKIKNTFKIKSRLNKKIKIELLEIIKKAKLFMLSYNHEEFEIFIN